MNRELYQQFCRDNDLAREWIDQTMRDHPELFPSAMLESGYWLDGFERESRKMPGIRLRRIRIRHTQNVFVIRPSFVLPSMTGFVDDVEKGLYLMSFGVPPEAIARCFGRDAMYWYRLVARLGSHSLAGTTLRNPEALPEHLAADEYHTTVNGTKVYMAVTAGASVFLGLSLTATADEAGLTDAYQDFRTEASNIDENYAPHSVNTDGWPATRLAWRALFPMVAVILCFLHGYLKVHDRCRRKFHDLRSRIWDVYRAATKSEFLQLMKSLATWCAAQEFPDAVRKAVEKLTSRGEQYSASYDHPGCHRTSNLVDRLMNLLDRTVHSGRRLHGHLMSAEQRLRGWALLINFRPFSRRHRSRLECQCGSPAERLNGFVYHANWLQNLYVSASLGGFRS